MPDRTYLAIDLKSFYASVECAARGLDPLKTNLVVADEERTEKTICLAVSPPLKAYGIGGRARLFEVNERVRQVNAERRQRAPGRTLTGSSCDADALAAQPELDDQIEALLDYYAGKPWEIDSPGCMTMDSSNADGTGGRTSSFQMHGMILTDRFYRFSLRGISVDTKNPDNVGIWALFLLQVDQPTDYAYCVAGEDDMVGIYVDLPAEQFDYEVTG